MEPLSSIMNRHSENVRSIRRIGWIGLAVNFILTLLKAVAGYLGGSNAVIADAVHSLSDMVTDVALVIGAGFWSAPPDENHPHGHRRVETLVTAGIGVVVGLAAVSIGWEAIISLMRGGQHAPCWIAFVAAAASIVAKEWLYRWTRKRGEELDSPAVIANAWHHRTDALSSVPPAIAVAAASAFPSLAILDSIAALLVAAFVLKAAWTISKPALAELTDMGAPDTKVREIQDVCLGTPGVMDCHAVRSRYLGSQLQVDLHILVDPSISVSKGHAIAHEAKNTLLERDPRIYDVTIHVEPYEGPEK
ncbi:cation diffusion facilitator family transporter [Oceanidesulfovibrio marinus]|uniref:Cation-efflux pump n=1 Tax=Oceanidesulfovibrio marinus TaxID=370038 RepID=A0A6P1ZQ24_9BACT|nr:cation diffusion facilitator family transporter [Oceanidesulfovibrio marinus]TVM36635.1 cation-efflux pump [Oceanidesulfovibrio marinus]